MSNIKNATPTNIHTEVAGSSFNNNYYYEDTSKVISLH